MTEMALQTNSQALSDLMNITPAAHEKFVSLLNDADDAVLGVRVYVTGGGCSGMQYGMTFADEKLNYDYSFTEGDLALLIDPVALNYMQGAQIDFVDDGINATFVFNDVFQSVGGSGACGGCGSAV